MTDWADRVEREVALQTAHRDTLYAKAQRRFARAKERLAKAQSAPKVHAVQVAKLSAEVERRRDELRRIEILMTETPAGSQHRGRGSYRGVG